MRHIESYYICYNCDWIRNLVVELEERVRELDHPIYGKVTFQQAADKDVATHDCEAYREARARAKERNRKDKLQAIVTMGRD